MPEATVAAIITNTSEGVIRVLLTRRAHDPFKNYWCIPGGHIEKFESSRNAIIREVKEETGLDFNAQFFGSFDEIIPDKNIHAVVSVYIGEVDGKIEPQPDEVTEIQLFTLAEALEMPLAFDHYRILETYAAFRQATD
jgi:8-oxo-dGTP diphosphatase